MTPEQQAAVNKKEVNTSESAIGLITPDNLPNDLIQGLTHSQIRKVGHFLFEQLIKQRDFTRKECKSGG